MTPGIVIGTHALIQEHVAFYDLALVVVDEQHRFGVEQRDALREKGRTPPHLLVMTATPIPRTVAMTVFGDMETSTLRELPAGRSPIQTHVVETTKPAWVDRTWQRIAEEVGKGHQAYVVCPKIGDPADPAAGDWARRRSQGRPSSNRHAEEDDGAPRELTGVYDLAERLRAVPVLAGLRIEVLHGRLDPDVKDRTMRAFAAGEIDVLVSTTVIEVGVDVAERLGHGRRRRRPLRHLAAAPAARAGRPGRRAGTLPADDRRARGDPARERLDAVAETTDGFELAQRDLELRREGDVLGARQSGRAVVGAVPADGEPDDDQIIAEAREDATEVVDLDPTLADHPDLAARVAARLDEEQAAYLERG